MSCCQTILGKLHNRSCRVLPFRCMVAECRFILWSLLLPQRQTSCPSCVYWRCVCWRPFPVIKALNWNGTPSQQQYFPLPVPTGKKAFLCWVNSQLTQFLVKLQYELLSGPLNRVHGVHARPCHWGVLPNSLWREMWKGPTPSLQCQQWQCLQPRLSQVYIHWK